MSSKEVADLILRVLDGSEEFHLVAGVTRDGGGAVTNHGNSRRSTLNAIAAYIAGGIVIPPGGISQAFADGRYLQKANNLSDVANVITARTNLSVYSKAEVDAAIAGAGGGGPWYKGHFPTTAILPTVITGGAAVDVTATDDASIGMLFDSGVASAGENYRVRYQAAPSNAASWAATCRVTANLALSATVGFGMFLGTVDANKWASSWGPFYSPPQIFSRRSFAGGFLANDFAFTTSDPGLPMWLRIRWDQPSATYFYDLSFDGKLWRNGGTRTIAQLGFTPDHIGLGCYVNNATAANKVMGSCDYWVVG